MINLKKHWVIRSILIFAFLFSIPIFVSLIPYGIGIVTMGTTYSEGDRVGQVIKLSEKGYIWKTWEGTMGLTQSGAYIESWDFSVDATAENKDKLLKELANAYNSGNIVRVHYKQTIGKRPWIGETSYLIQDIQSLATTR